jgi:hypothetical protein
LRERRSLNLAEVKSSVSLQTEVAVCCTARANGLLVVCKRASVSTKKYEKIFASASEGNALRSIDGIEVGRILLQCYESVLYLANKTKIAVL